MKKSCVLFLFISFMFLCNLDALAEYNPGKRVQGASLNDRDFGQVRKSSFFYQGKTKKLSVSWYCRPAGDN